jgi:hypothetical protein
VSETTRVDVKVSVDDLRLHAQLDQIHTDNAGDPFRIVRTDGGFERVSIPAMLAVPDEEC